MEKKEAFFHLIDFLRREEIRYALVGDTSEYPDKIGSDVDIITDTNGLARFRRKIASLEKEGLSLVQRFRHEITAYYYILYFSGPDGAPDFIHPDICTDYYRHAIKLLDAEPMLARAILKPCSGCSGGGFMVLAPQDEFAYYLLKKIGKGAISETQFEHLRESFVKAPDACRDRTAALSPLLMDVVQAVESGSFQTFSAAMGDTKAAVLRSGAFGKPQKVRDAMRKLSRVLHPTGLVAVSPDASVRAELRQQLFRAFRREAEYKAKDRPPFLKLAKAKVSSTLVLLDSPPSFPDSTLVDIDLSTSQDPVRDVIEFLARRSTAD